MQNSKVMLVGECWGEAEAKVGLPFQGLAGKVLDGILDEVGLQREMCQITNVIHERPPNNNFAYYYEKVGKKTVPTSKLLQAYERLANEIVACHPNIIVCLGNEAMKAVLGYGGVMDWRGSVIQSKYGKVIPTIHPAAILREWSFRPAVVCDFERIVKESEYEEIKTRTYRTEVNTSLEVTLSKIEQAKQTEFCAFDIETESNQITCIGLAYQPDESVCIPFWFGSSGSIWTEEEEQLIWFRLKELLELNTPKKIAHNCMYELEFLTRTTGIRPRIHYDTMLMFHVLYPELPKSLAYLTSTYTDHIFYKHQRRTNKMDELWKYNATDAMMTYEIATKLIKELDDSNMMDFYQQYEHSLIEPLFAMSTRGVKFDTVNRTQLKEEFERSLTEMQQQLNSLVGHDINIGSHLQMTKWLYEELGLPKLYTQRKGRDVKTLATDEGALSTLHTKHNIPALAVVLAMREKKKVLSTYLNMRLDDDKRIRCTYNIGGTETGRLSSSTTGFGTGTNLQNIPEGEIKALFVANEGCVLVNADLSQAEARVVAYLSEDQRLLEVFNVGGDIHTKNAAKMFNKAESQVTKEERYLAKRAVHGLNYGMGLMTFAAETGIDLATAKRVYNIYFATFPRIKLWHMQVKDKLQKTRTLTTPFGRKRTFFNRWNDSLLKEGLAYVPQSTVAELVNQAIVSLHRSWLDNTDKQLLLQVHDSILVQCKEECLVETVQQVKEVMNFPLEINGRIMTIPVDVKVGYDWNDMKGIDVWIPQEKSELTV